MSDPFLMALTLTGCISVSEKEKKERLDFTVVKADLPEEVKSQIEAHKKRSDETDLVGSGVLYLIRGYGTQKTTGFSVVVDALYETEDEIIFRTTLKGRQIRRKRKTTTPVRNWW